MKKFAIGAILGASLLISSSAFALTSMTADSMKSATGQAGVSIAIDNVVIEQYVGSTTYTDDDGVLGTGAGSIVISEKHTVKKFDAMTSATDFHKSFSEAANKTYTAAVVDDLSTTGVDETVAEVTFSKGVWNKAAALTIDVGECKVLAPTYVDTPGWTTSSVVTGVVIGLPTLLITTSEDSYNVGVKMEGAINNDTNFINISKGASVMAILGGTVEIAAH